MALTLCPNCRLPVNEAVRDCPLCAAPMATATKVMRRRMPVAAAVAVVATLAMLARRYA